jgi:histidyl-tRNA synthetase
MSTGALPGFRDFYPTEFAERAALARSWRDVARRYGFTEYDGPPLEPTELYTKKSGEEIVGQLYTFTDKGGRSVALRPEMTPTFTRMVAARANALPKPVRWFSIPQLFRYERQQRGRLREHFQLNVDIVGEAGVRADAELVCCALDVMRSLGLTGQDVVARFSDRRVLNLILLNHRVPRTAFPAVYAVLDKFHRQPRNVSADKLIAAGLTRGQAEALFADVDTVAATGTGITAATGDDAEDRAGRELLSAIDQYQMYIAALMGAPAREWVQWDLTIVRGLAYYTGIVFEIFDRRGELRAVCGGGRYDGLLAAAGGPDLPALGFGMGDVVLTELLRDRGLLRPELARLDYWVAADADDDDSALAVTSIAGQLRRAGRSAEYAFRWSSLARQLKAASGALARRAVIVKQDAAATGMVTVKDLDTGHEESVRLDSWIAQA